MCVCVCFIVVSGSGSSLMNSIMHTRYLADMESKSKVESTWTSSDDDSDGD